MKINTLLSLSLVLILLRMEHAHAEPVVTINTIYYDISGTSNGALHREMLLKGPSAHRWNGTRMHAYATTAWHVNWNADYKPTGYGCTVSAVQTTVSIRFIYPRWTGRSNARPNMGRQWDRMYQALVAHEETHASHGIAAARQIETELLQLSRRNSCTGFRRDIDNRAQKIVQHYRNADKLFDQHTNHGGNEGVYLPR